MTAVDEGQRHQSKNRGTDDEEERREQEPVSWLRASGDDCVSRLSLLSLLPLSPTPRGQEAGAAGEGGTLGQSREGSRT